MDILFAIWEPDEYTYLVISIRGCILFSLRNRCQTMAIVRGIVWSRNFIEEQVGHRPCAAQR